MRNVAVNALKPSASKDETHGEISEGNFLHEEPEPAAASESLPADLEVIAIWVEHSVLCLTLPHIAEDPTEHLT